MSDQGRRDEAEGTLLVRPLHHLGVELLDHRLHAEEEVQVGLRTDDRFEALGHDPVGSEDHLMGIDQGAVPIAQRRARGADHSARVALIAAAMPQVADVRRARQLREERLELLRGERVLVEEHGPLCNKVLAPE
eukprot:CAMPEP_0195634376 /NCGR_PEP_ID=MMETSP0815-20121206/22666_1 /TAXON_ID=97485 /ORGANISM="Prymnesium parvum, Strain Texoma1" /LENGTH=133 /DNA_ID=CAMNT_0040776141 /DNA_START=486 /DNA_END=888 /DNA_ORIENTATION=-